MDTNAAASINSRLNGYSERLREYAEQLLREEKEKVTKYSIDKLSPEEWTMLAEDAHMTVFGETRPVGLNRHHFVMAVSYDKKMGGYFTCLEMDSETLYVQYGGVFPNFIKTIHAAQGYAFFIEWCCANYKRVVTKIENTNEAMIRLAMKMGFVVNGSTTFKNKIYLELINEF